MARPHTILLLILLIVSLSTRIPQSNSETESVKQSLFRFIEKLSGSDDFPTQGLKWNITSDPCRSSWRGVYCDDTDSVVSIYLSGFRFTGTFEPELLCPSAKSLSILWLANNTISGPIPDSMSNCSGLVILELGDNRISGSIPNSILGLANLTGLGISNNEISGEIPEGLADVLHLAYFFADQNRLTGAIPDFDTRVMERLNVSYNNLSGPIPEGLGRRFDDENRFMGNPGLCGKPLPNSCLGPEPAPSQPGNDCGGLTQKWVVMVLALVFSFILVACP